MTFYVTCDRFETSVTLSHNTTPASGGRETDWFCVGSLDMLVNVHRTARAIVFGETKCIFLCDEFPMNSKQQWL
jgi:hypothetical protein